MLLQENFVGCKARKPKGKNTTRKKRVKEVSGYSGFGHHRWCEFEGKKTKGTSNIQRMLTLSLSLCSIPYTAPGTEWDIMRELLQPTKYWLKNTQIMTYIQHSIFL